MKLLIRSIDSRIIRAFTLVELMVAVGLLLVVIIAVSRIFSTASKVAGLGEAVNDILQETGAIERQIRTDISRIDYDGVLVIQCVAIKNNANLLSSSSAPLIDPTRPANATIRCDQLVFFSKGTQTSARFAGNQDLGPFNGLARSNLSRILYGHGVQLPDLIPQGATSSSRPDPIAFSDAPLLPWSFDTVASGSLEYKYWWGGGGGVTNGTQPEARDWTLARQAILLADDGGDLKRFHKATDSTQTTYGNNSAVSLFEQANLETVISDGNLLPNSNIINSRVDVAATNLNDIRKILAPVGSTTWRQRIVNGFFGPFAGYGQLAGYVRSEKVAPSMNRQDVMLTTPTLATNCSGFMVDWTWGEFQIPGVVPYDSLPNPPPAIPPTKWYGFPDRETLLPLPLPNTFNPEWRGVRTLTQDLPSPPPNGWLINPSVIEGVNPIIYPLGPTGPIKIYTAVFGFNGDKPVFQTMSMQANGTAAIRDDYTPWPTALRITMQLHDPEKRIEEGKTLQLIVELPKRPSS